MDAGNSRLKWASLEAGELSAVSYEAYAAPVYFETVREVLASKQVKKLVIVHVLGDTFEASLQQLCEQQHIGLQVIKSEATAYGVSNAYDHAEQLGADRFVAMIALHQKNRLAGTQVDTIAISCGTALTIDAMNNEGVHLGGLILPGLQLWKDALINGATLLKYSNDSQVSVFATNTGNGIEAGSLYGLAGAVDNICQQMSLQCVQPVQFVISGGCAETLLPYLHNNYNYEPDLVMQGLKTIVESSNA